MRKAFTFSPVVEHKRLSCTDNLVLWGFARESDIRQIQRMAGLAGVEIEVEAIDIPGSYGEQCCEFRMPDDLVLLVDRLLLLAEAMGNTESNGLSLPEGGVGWSVVTPLRANRLKNVCRSRRALLSSGYLHWFAIWKITLSCGPTAVIPMRGI